ncbi:MAG: translation elongation factor-like protein [Candidatus Micrarchaeota archaeon]|nr:translation elongation factor-like protein [Candidatus Micrarchaeota archaeon]
MPEMILVGKVKGYFENIGVAAVELVDELNVGDRILIEKDGVSFEQVVSSMELEKLQVQRAFTGDRVGLKLDRKAEEGSSVYKLVLP